MIGQVWNWLNQNGAVLSLLIALVPLVWAAVSYVSLKRSENKQRRFENYHALIKQLVQGDDMIGAPYIDRQLAVVFELQRYPEYSPATLRVLTGFRESAESWHNRKAAQRLIEQIDESLKKLS